MVDTLSMLVARLPKRPLGTRLLLAGLAAAACGGSDNSVTSPDDSQSFAGAYALLTINDTPLPYVLLDLGDAYKYVVVSDVLMFQSGGTVTEVNVSRVTESGITSTITQSGTGSFVFAGTHVAVAWPASGSYNYAVVSEGLSEYELTFAGNWLYKKQ